LGVLTQAAIIEIGREQVRQVFGVIILIALLVQQVWQVQPREHLHIGWGILAAVLCGYMAGLAGMGGPALVMWVMAHTWSNQRSRSTLWSVFLGLTPFQLFFLFQRFEGDGIVPAMGNALLLAPITLLGVYPGIWLGNRIPREMLRRLALLALGLISVYLIFSPLINAAISDATAAMSASPVHG
ncbi:MAG: TSUP family transporter, partial [Planctomycetota bacterium]